MDERQAAAAKINELTDVLKTQTESRGSARGGNNLAELLDECHALGRAVAAFHLEGIRFRMFNVDRLLAQADAAPSDARKLLEDVRRHLEAAGFHTRSHQAPG
jgi:hypothetical protein